MNAITEEIPLDKSKKTAITIIIFILLGIFFIYYPYMLKNKIISKYRAGLENAIGKLDEEKKKEAREALTYLERGEFVPDQEHDTGDFFHKDYFSESWRDWKNTYVLWAKARNYYFVFIILLAIIFAVEKIKTRKMESSG